MTNHCFFGYSFRSSLQIFENEKHASVHSDKTKEGLSLAGELRAVQYSLSSSLGVQSDVSQAF